MGRTEGIVEISISVDYRSADLYAHGRVRDSDNDDILKLRMADVVGEAGRHMELRRAAAFRNAYRSDAR